METLKVIKEANAGNAICYIATEKKAKDKMEVSTSDFKLVDSELATSILTEYNAFVEYGAKDTPSYIFTKGNDTDWFLAQVEIKNEII
jgi:hypothetical protein